MRTAQTDPNSTAEPESSTTVPAITSPYLTAPEAAAYIRSTVPGIYSLLKRGKLHKLPGSRKVLFTREALDRYLTTRPR